VTTPENPPRVPMSKGRRALAIFIGIGLTTVITAPIVLSSQDLIKWATSPEGLGMDQALGWIVILALDLAAATCVGMVTFSAWRGEGGGTFHLLTWMFALASAWANYRHGTSTPAKDDEYFFPAMSLAGPLLLDITLARIKSWVRKEQKTQMSARPRFGARWIPGVAFRETAMAWAASRREDIAKPADAIAYVRESRAVKNMNEIDAIRYAWSALNTFDEYRARTWLTARGVNVSQNAIDDATAGRPRTPLAGVSDTGPIPAIRSDRAELPPTTLPAIPAPTSGEFAEDAAMLDALKSKRDKIRHAFAAIGEYDVSRAVEWLLDRGVSVDKSDAYSVRKTAQEADRAGTLRVVGTHRKDSN
jgi:uncharacterized protein DUF2637